MTEGARLATLALGLFACACGAPTPPTLNGYAGAWSGTTAQGRAIVFSISGEVVTSITLGHDFSGCSGSETFSNLHLDISPNTQCVPGPCPPVIASYRAFEYASGDPAAGPSTELHAVFVSMERAEGTVNFRGFPACGTAIGVPWSATRR